MKAFKLQIRTQVNSKTGARKASAMHKRFRADGVVGFSEQSGVVRVQTAGDGDNFEVEEGFDEVAEGFASDMVVVTALCFVGDDASAAKIRPSGRLGLNPDRFTYRAFGDATVIAVEGVPRDLIVRETVAEIDALIDG